MKLKHILLSFLLISTFFNCSKNDDDNRNGNPNIPNAVFDTQGLINTSLPQYNQMQFPGNHVVLNNNYGINGVVVYYSGSSYSAFELSDPSHQLTSCSTLTVDGIIATCSCTDNNTFEINGGLPTQGTTSEYPLTRYFVEVNGDIIRVYNN